VVSERKQRDWDGLNDLGDDRKERDGRMGRDVIEKARERCFEIGGRMMRNKYSTRRYSVDRRRGRQRRRRCPVRTATVSHIS